VEIEMTLTSSIPAADLKKFVEGQKATFSPSVTESCTHLITTQKDVEKNTTKCESGLSQSRALSLTRFTDRAACEIQSCQIVSHEWLLDSLDAKKPLAEEDYILGSDQNGSGQSALQDSADEKTATQDDTKSGTLPGTASVTKKYSKPNVKENASTDAKKDQKKNAQTDSTKKRDFAQLDSIEQDAKKKPKDAQKAGFKSLNIPVDEVFLREERCYKSD
jgi:poly [ADP-ribose] polymerase